MYEIAYFRRNNLIRREKMQEKKDFSGIDFSFLFSLKCKYF